MIVPGLLLVHAVLGGIGLLARPAEKESRTKILQFLAGAGVVFALALFFAPGSQETWRTTDMDPTRAHLVGAAIGCAWLLCLVLERTSRAGAWDAVVLVGTASTAVALFGFNRWAVPGSLFLVVAAVALAALGHRAPGGGSRVAVVLIGSGLFAGGIAAEVLGSERWEMPVDLSGWPAWPVAAGIVLLSGAIPGTTWSVAASAPVAAGLPLATGASFLMLASPSGIEAPLIALVLVVVALGCSVWTIARPAIDVRSLASWAIALMLGIGFASPDGPLVAQAGGAAVIVVTAITLWPLSYGRGQIERGLLVAFVSLTAGFGAITIAAEVAFERATATDAVLTSAPWAAIAALLPAALASGVALGARLARRAEPEEYTVAGVLATWALFFAAVTWGIFSVDGVGTSSVWLYAVAAAVGAAAARVAAVRSSSAPPRAPDLEPVIGTGPPASPALDGALGRVAMGIGAATAIGVLAITYQGLRVGFL